MPNGDPDWRRKELPKLRTFFRGIKSVLKKFASDHNLKIEKYYHQGSGWTFRFRHPDGGVGSITVNRYDETQVIIYPHWYIDHYDTTRRDFKKAQGTKCFLESQTLRSQLVETLMLVISWRKEQLIKGVENPYCEKIKRSQKQFEKDLEKYPFPKLE